MNLKKVIRNNFSSSNIEKIKWLYIGFLRLNCWLKSFFSSSKTTTLFHASIQKTGSSWITDVLTDKRLLKKTHLNYFPQGRYEWGDFIKKFPKSSYIPGLFIPYQLFQEIKKPNKYKVIYIVRDPRAILLSWYWSAKETHSLMGRVDTDRKVLLSKNFDDGLIYSIDQLSLKFEYMKSWLVNASSDKSVLILKFEDIIKDPSFYFKNIFDHLGVDIAKEELEIILSDYTLDKLRKRDLEERGQRGNQDNSGHYSQKGKNWKNDLSPEVLTHLYKNTESLWDYLDYEK